MGLKDTLSEHYSQSTAIARADTSDFDVTVANQATKIVVEIRNKPELQISSRED